MEGHVISHLISIFNTPSGKTSKGAYFEKKAMRYLARQGMKNFSCNYHCRFGEIDLIAHDGDGLVFIEVRYREKSNFGSALDSVTVVKQKKIRRTAKHFLQKHGLGNKMPCRFDVIGITGYDGNLNYQWIKNAF